MAAETTARVKRDADYIFYELTRSICPHCRRVIDAQILLRDGKVYMRKRCPEHGWTEALVSSDALAYTSSSRYNKPGTIPLDFSTEVKEGCPLDCGLCPEHKQHTCLALIEVNTACNLACPICFADAGPGYSLTLPEVERMLDRLVEVEGNPEVVQFSGGEPTLHPELPAMIRAAKARGVKHVMVNTNGRRIAHDDAFLEALAEARPAIYFQFDGLRPATYQALRGEDLLEEKLLALDRLATAGLDVALVAAIERGVNEEEVGPIVRFGLRHPAVRGIVFQPVTHVARHVPFDPLQRVTIPEVLQHLEEQSHGLFRRSDFVPVPCCFPTCQSITYAYVDGDQVLPLPRVLNVDRYLDYITNRALPELSPPVLKALEGLWSASSVPGSTQAAERFCAACDWPASPADVVRRLFMVTVKDFLDPWTFNVKQVMKCCIAVLVPDGRLIPFCAYNSVGYREQVRAQLMRRRRRGRRA